MSPLQCSLTSSCIVLVVSNNKRGARRGTGKRRSHRRNNGGDPVGKFAGDAWSLAKRAVIGLNEIRKLVNIETKILDTSATTLADNTGSIVALSSIAQGVDFNQRVGDSIKVQHMELRFNAVMNAAAVNTSLRVIIFRDLDGYGTAPTAGDLMQISGTASAALSPYKWLNRKRFSIILDELINLNQTGQLNWVFDFEQTFEKHTYYLGTTAAAGSNGKGTFYLLVTSSENVANAPTYRMESRLLFTDD